MTAHRLPTRLLAALAVAATPFAQAAQTQIADEPLITQAEFKPKPNLMVILDDSGSMNFEYLPDVFGRKHFYNNSGISNGDGAVTTMGFYSSQCNGVAYNPGSAYDPPLSSVGTPYTAQTLAAARDDGFSATSTPTNLATTTQNWFKIGIDSGTLSTGSRILTVSSKMAAELGANSFVVGDEITLTASSSRKIVGTVTAWNGNTKALTLNITQSNTTSRTGDWTMAFKGRFFYTYTGSQTPMSWTYPDPTVTPPTAGLSPPDTTTTFAQECRAFVDDAMATKVFELNVVSANSPATTQTNYANWYAYYRKRMYMARTAMGRALQPLDDTYRIGYSQINNADSLLAGNSATKFRPVSDFNASQKGDFYASLYAATPSGSTPLRGALSRAGRYFAKNLSSQKTEPMQYACQRNFALLTTDGYWNETDFSGGGLANATIGNADGSAGAPYQDGASNTLADVAYYYYTTDLRNGTAGSTVCTGAPVDGRPGQDVCANILTPSGKDIATHQHMTTFTIGMGLVGTVSTTADVNTVSWPSPVNNTITTVDDLYHASINGRGQHYSAQNSAELTTAIQSIVTAIQDVSGAGSATATSTLDLVQGENNIAFEASYTTGSWFGDVLARKLDARTAEVIPGDPEWSAREKLNARSAAGRTIYFKKGAALAQFTWANLTPALQANFENLCNTPAKLTQCATLSASHQTTVNGGAELVSYLRGDRTKEASSTNTTAPLFRERKSVLGDIINSKPIHVGKPPFDYADTGYATFKTSNLTRKKMVYVGANDGMLHALDAATGEELWAYVPTAVMPNLYKLADVKYGSNTSQPHTYFVDGKTVQGDVKIGGVWKTILVGGLNKGGRAYYALDITDPENPQALWEFAHDDSTVHNNLGLTYSDPVISKLDDGTWTVAFGSGYNNVSPGDGKGRLFVVNAATGAILRNIATTAGGTTTPSGLSKINVWVKALNDNTAQRFYAGDLLGNVWRFDVDDKVLPHKAAMQLAQMQDASGTPQPITTEPKLREYDKQPVVVVATGRYLGRDDIDDTQVQSIAAIRDPLTATGWGAVRTNTAKFKKVTITKSGTTASGAAVTVDWATDGGWWADFPTAGERVAMPMEWDGARLLAATTLPSGDQCKSGGASWLYSFGLAGGKTDAEQFSEDTLIVGFSVVTNDEGQPKILVRTSDNQTVVKDGTGLGGGTTIKRARRVSWRELP